VSWCSWVCTSGVLGYRDTAHVFTPASDMLNTPRIEKEGGLPHNDRPLLSINVPPNSRTTPLHVSQRLMRVSGYDHMNLLCLLELISPSEPICVNGIALFRPSTC